MRIVSVAGLMLLVAACGEPDGGAATGGVGVGGGSGGGGGGEGADGPLSVRIVAPANRAAVSGDVDVELEVTGAVAEVEITVNGKPGCTAAAPSFACELDVTHLHDNVLAAASHAIDFGYYYVDGKYGDYRSEVNGHTSLYYALAAAGYVSELPWGEAFSQSLANADAERRSIHLNVAGPDNAAEALDRAAPHWGRVARVELADEPPWSQTETEGILAAFRSDLETRGLSAPPLGIVYTRDQVLTGDAIFSAGLDWVGIEAYVDPPGDPSAEVDIQLLTDFVNQAKARVPAEKNLVLVMQAYDRNGQWTDMETLAALQVATYDLARDDPRVIALTMFAYGRPGGTHDHPELRLEHLRIGEKLLGIVVPELSNGPATIEARATSRAGAVSTDEIVVAVANGAGP